MSEKKTTILTRYSRFWNDLRNYNWKDRVALLHWVGWSVSLLFLSLNIQLASNRRFHIFLVIHIYFLYKIIKRLYQRIRIPVDLILIISAIFFYIFKGSVTSLDDPVSTFSNPNFLIILGQIFFIGIVVFLYSLMLLYNNSGKAGVLILNMFILLLGHYTILGGNTYLIFIYQVLLFIILLNNTKWLEDLTRNECWLYLILSFILFQIILKIYPFGALSAKNFQYAAIGFTYPLALYYYAKIYLFAVLVKIPIVLVYNHAPLSKKLQISGLFQSIFPQLIQLIMLILIFYAFLSGWQAENLRNRLKDQLIEIQQGQIYEGITTYQFQSRNRQLDQVKLNEYNITMNIEHLPKRGVLQIHTLNYGRPDYFIFSKSTKLDSNFFYLIKLDSVFLSTLKNKFQYLAGTSLMAYSFSPDKLPAYLYRIDFWQNDRYVKIFPFGIKPNDSTNAVNASLLDFSEQEQNSTPSFWSIPERNLIFGRLFLDVWELHGSKTTQLKDNYVFLDIVFTMKSDRFWSGLPQIILMLILLYLLLNAVVIRRVVRFGAEINHMIVQKFQQLKGGITQISSGNLSYKIEMEGDDEFVELADQFNNMGNQLQQSITEAREKERLEFEMQSARQVQLSLLPREIPTIPDYEIAASLKTATEVGGDFYDLFRLDEHRFLFTIGDVSGKGSSAAFYMAQFMSLVRYSQQFTFEPDEICSRLNYYFAHSITDSQIFVTAIIGILNTKNNTLNFVRAGHTEPIFVPADQTKNIIIPPTKGIGIGLTKSTSTFSKSLNKNELFINKGDTIIFYTDGVIEASRHSHDESIESNEPSDMYGEARLKNLIKQNRGQNPTKLIKELDMDIESFYAGHPRVDDHTILIIQRLNHTHQI